MYQQVARQNELLYSLLWEALPLSSTPVNNNEVNKHEILTQLLANFIKSEQILSKSLVNFG